MSLGRSDRLQPLTRGRRIPGGGSVTPARSCVSAESWNARQHDMSESEGMCFAVDKTTNHL